MTDPLSHTLRNSDSPESRSVPSSKQIEMFPLSSCNITSERSRVPNESLIDRVNINNTVSLSRNPHNWSMLHTALPNFEVATPMDYLPTLSLFTNRPQDCLEVRTFGLQTHVIRRLKGLRGPHHVNCAATYLTRAEQSCENQRDVLRRFVCSVASFSI